MITGEHVLPELEAGQVWFATASSETRLGKSVFESVAEKGKEY